jgi:uncharacterized protein with PIN domain
MEIIKRGVKPEFIPRQVSCYNCKSVLEYVQADIHHDQREGDYVICPVCGKYLNTRK